MGRKRKLTKKHVPLVRKLMFKDRLTGAEIAEQLGVHISTLGKFTRRYKITDDLHRRLHDQDLSAIRRWHLRDGLTQKEIGKRLRVTGNTVKEFMRKHSIPLQTHGGGHNKKLLDHNAPRIAFLYKIKGYTVKQVAEELNSTPSAVSWLMDKKGISRRALALSNAALGKRHVSRVTRMLKKGAVRREIAEELGVDTCAVDTLIRNFNLCPLLQKNQPTWKTADGYTMLRISHLPEEDQLLAKRLTDRASIAEHKLLGAIKKNIDPNQPEQVEAYNKKRVHHLNGNKGDNRPENLLILTSKEHYRIIPAYRERITDLETFALTLIQLLITKNTTPSTKEFGTIALELAAD